MPLMRTMTALIVFCATAPSASWSETQADPRTVDRQIDARLSSRFQNARLLNRSMRAENIRDEEVRELQSVIATLDKGSITSIGPVIAGCRCEEGPACTAEVTVALHKPGQSVGMNFSRIEGKWQLGMVQKWDLKYEAAQARYWNRRVPAAERGKQQQVYAEELATLLAEMPQCAANATQSTPKTAAGAAEKLNH
jgi:hypothetical protein